MASLARMTRNAAISPSHAIATQLIYHSYRQHYTQRTIPLDDDELQLLAMHFRSMSTEMEAQHQKQRKYGRRGIAPASLKQHRRCLLISTLDASAAKLHAAILLSWPNDARTPPARSF